MTWLLLATLLAWLAFGPWVLLVALALLLVPRVRWWVQDYLVLSRRRTTLLATAVVALIAAVLVVPDGWLPIPPGPGGLATPSYLGRPASVHPLSAGAAPQNPHLAAPPTTGPLGLQPQVDTAWFGRESCADLASDTQGRLVAVCEGRGRPRLHVVDAGSMRKLASLDLPERADSPGDSACDGTAFYLDDQDRAVLATADRQVEALRTSDGDGDPDLTVDQSWDLRPYVPDGDCLVALVPDWSGRIWWASHAGLVGTIAPETGDVGVDDLGEAVHDDLVADETGVLVVTDHSLQRLQAGPDGQPERVWRTPYDRGEEPKPGQLTRGSGTGATLLQGGSVVAFADNAEPAMHVVFVQAATGEEICRRAVFEDGASATEAALVSVGDGVVVVNQYGNRGRRSTVLGFASEPGIVRVDVAGGDCTVRWSSDEVVPSGTPQVSWANGLVYAYTKRPSWTGVSAWYVTALEADSGRARWSARAGTGTWYDDRGATLALGPDATLWAGTVSGLVRVRDRDPG